MELESELLSSSKRQQKWKRIALSLLARREHSEKEIVHKLGVKGASKNECEALLAFLLEKDYLSNERFTETFARSKMNAGLGPVRIKLGLIENGIPQAAVDIAVEELDVDWQQKIYLLNVKKYGDSPITDYNMWAKRARFFFGRGFTAEQVHKALPSIERVDF